MADARHRTLAAAESLAHAPGLPEALNSDNPTAELQPRAEAARKASGVDAIIVYKLDGVTLTHSDTEQIGKHVIGPYAEAAGGCRSPGPRGRTGPLRGLGGPHQGLRGRVVGIVAAPVTVEKVQNSVNRQLPVFLGSAAGALVVAGAGAGLVSHWLRRQTHGLGPAEMTRMYEHHDAVLHAVREGVLIIGHSGKLLLANDEARRLLELPEDSEGRDVTDLELDDDTAELLASDRIATDEVHLAADRLPALNKRSTTPFGDHHGSVVTLRDTTELRSLSGRAEAARERLKLLYDAGVRWVPRWMWCIPRRNWRGWRSRGSPTWSPSSCWTPSCAARSRPEQVPSCAGQPWPALPRTTRSPVGELIHFAPGTPMADTVEQGHSAVVRDLAASPGWRA